MTIFLLIIGGISIFNCLYSLAHINQTTTKTPNDHLIEVPIAGVIAAFAIYFGITI